MVDQHPPGAHLSSEIIRIFPVRIIAWNLDPDHPGTHSRPVTAAVADDRVA